jgi:hypothetical protein
MACSLQRHEALVLSLRQTSSPDTSQQESANASQHHCSMARAVIQ